ncbi:MAG: thioesterase family protein [Acidobacteriota bacterium]
MSPAPASPACRVLEKEVELRPGDIDSAGHLNHVAMVGLFEHARVGAHHQRRQEVELPDCATVVRRLTVDYHGQARVFELMTVRSWILRDGGSSRTWQQELVGDDGRLVARAEVVSVWVDVESGRPRRLPEFYREAFAEYRQPEG